MNGKQLYEAFVRIQLELNNCTIDTWDELEEADREAWRILSDIVRPED
jgi:hypothetical protein